MSSWVKYTGLLLSGVILGGLLVVWFGSPKEGPGNNQNQPREVLYWVAPMDASYRRDEPGQSPMGMDLVPVYADENEGVAISPSVAQSLGVRTAIVESGPLWRRIDATGYVAFDESLISHIHLRTQGWIERLYVQAEGEQVEQGALLLELYSPELLNAQKEYLQSIRRGNQTIVAASEEKLSALGMNQQAIQNLREVGRAAETVKFYAPQAGVVTDLKVREGMHVMPSTNVMSLSDLSSVWVNAEVFARQADWVAVGQQAEVELSYLPDRSFSGQVDYVYPVVDPQSRTLKVRLRFDNPEGLLKPNMYGRVLIYGGAERNVLSIPSQALIRSEDMDRVIVALGDGEFQAREVSTGLESGDWVEIIAGLSEGEQIVTSAQFLLDSEASLSGSLLRLSQWQPDGDHRNAGDD